MKAILFLITLTTISAGEDVPSKRVTPWTSSRILGSPDPALPYKTQRVFANVELNQPTDIIWLADAKRWIATQLNGQIVSFENDHDTAITRPVLDLKELHQGSVSTVVSTTFHPDLANEPWCYVCYASNPKAPNGRHLARFRVTDATIPTIDLSSRAELLSWAGSGHTGGSVQFGPDGYLYVSVGDTQNPYPPDERNTGQDLSDLEASILRIDVNNPTDDEPYRIPADNPFAGSSNVRGEIWAFGFRNPWKMSFNPETGDLFTADVGWEMREMVYRVERGGNYGWSIMEGSQPVKQYQQPSIPITPPIFEHTHLDARSITGGYFWQSEHLPELKGAYIYGDWMTGKVWALKTSDDNVLWQKELVDTPLQIISFMLDPTGEVMIVGYDGTIHKLLPKVESTQQHEFPKQLSQTGLFQDVVTQQPEPGVVEYEFSAHHWADGTHSRQWIAIPGSEQLGLWDNPRWDVGQVHGRFKFPTDTVVAKTVSYYSEVGNPKSQKHLETQILHLLGDEWRAYNYVWNEEQTDATLQDDVATDRKLTIQDPNEANGRRIQTWHHASRSECLLCHIWSSGTVQGFAPDQINISVNGKDQLADLVNQGLFSLPIPVTEPIASPHDATRSIEDRGRAYLAMNCSNCHRRQGGGTANFNFEINKSLVENMFIDAVPAQGDFGIANARIVAPGDPFRSVVLYRTLKFGRGHMPQFGSNVIDTRGIQVLHDWITSMAAPDKEAVNEQAAITELAAMENPEPAIATLLSTTRGAVALSFACGNESMQDSLRLRIIEIASQHGDAQIRDLFEGYLPEELRVQRLGPTIDESSLLAMQGSAERGRQLFEQATEITCRQCHQVGSIGKNIGPDLSGIGAKQTPADVLASILRPSEKIDPKYRTQTVLTVDGNVVTGIIISDTETQLVLSDAQAKTHTIAKDEIELVQTSSKSVMPEMLLAGMTTQQGADLLAFLSEQRKVDPPQQ